jgi:hypothetical protein
MFKLFIFIFFPCSVIAQNLVPNYSFEDTSCTVNVGSPTFFGATNWFNPNDATPDYYGIEAVNNCFTSIYNSNWQSTGEWQYPLTGQKMIGLFASIEGSCTREYIEVELNEALIANLEYCVSINLSLSNRSQICTDCFGVYFSVDELLNPDGYCEFGVQPQLVNSPGTLLSDTLNWMQVSGTFVANGGEKYLTVGNFLSDEMCTIAPVNGTKPNFNVAYYYVDDVVVMNCDSTDVIEFNSETRIEVFPNPTSGFLSISCPHGGIASVYDMAGRRVSQHLYRAGGVSSLDLTSLEMGIYSLRFTDERGFTYVKTFIKY